MGRTGVWLRLRAALVQSRARDPALFYARLGLALLLLLLVARLVFGDNPWQDGIAKRLAEGKSLRFSDYVETWGWWAALGLAPVVAALLAAAPRWLVRGPAPECPSLAPPARPSRAFGLLVAGAVAAGGVLAAPRLSQSLFEDERYNVKWSIDGFYYRAAGGEIRFHDPDWRAALWHYEWPNNHVPHTLLARAGLGTWRLLVRPESHFVNEAVLRLPALLAAFGSIVAVALLLWRLGHARAGVVAAWILALHPWHLRYASEARGYSLALLAGTLLLLGLLRALRHGTWGRWLFVGAMQLLLLWTYPAAVWLALAANVLALVSLWHLHGPGSDLRVQLTRWAVIGIAGAVAWILAMAPNLAQLADYMETNTAQVTPRWYRDVGAYFLVGLPWGGGRPNPHFWELSDAAARWPLLFRAGVAAAVALVAAGGARLVTGWPVRTLLLFPLVLPPALTLWLAGATGAKVHPHYLVLALPGATVLAALGVEWVAARFGSRGGIAILVLALMGFGVVTEAPRRQLRAAPLQPWRDSVELTRAELDPAAAAADRVITVSFYMAPVYYDPRVHRIDNPEELRDWMREADASDRALYVNYGRPRLAQQRLPELVELVSREDLFEELALLRGLPPRGDRRVLRYRRAAGPASDAPPPGSAATRPPG
jgi:hypothetical protein